MEGGATSLRLRLHDPSGEMVVQGKGVNPVLEMPDPQLWWPNGHGEQPLYTLEVSLIGAVGELLDARQQRLGFRRLELLREPLPEGESFVFRVNGRCLFVAGANWIPDDTQLARVTKERLRARLEAACEANFSMVRVWGHGLRPPLRWSALIGSR